MSIELLTNTSFQKDLVDNFSCSSSSFSSYLFPNLFEFIIDEEWDIIRECLKSTKAVLLCQERDDTNLSCLSVAIAYQAPLEIIKDMVQIDPSLLTYNGYDDYGATPLHVGCLNGASLETLDFILNRCKELATALDRDQRSSLHHATEYVCGCCSSDSSTSANESNSSEQEEKPLRRRPYSYCISLLKMICKAAPEMVHVQDNIDNGLTPLDLIQLHKAAKIPGSEEYKKLLLEI